MLWAPLSALSGSARGGWRPQGAASPRPARSGCTNVGPRSASTRLEGKDSGEGGRLRASLRLRGILWAWSRNSLRRAPSEVPWCWTLREGMESKAVHSDRGATRRWTTVSTPKTLAKWSQSTRLETRTKESNIYASVKVQNLWTRNESKGPLALGWTPFRGAHSTDLDIF